MTSRRDRLRGRRLPTAKVPLSDEVIELRALEPKRFEELMLEHPPTEAQREAERSLPWNPDTFLPALLEACEVPLPGEERMPAVEWAELEPRLPFGDWDALVGAALALNDRSPAADVGKA